MGNFKQWLEITINNNRDDNYIQSIIKLTDSHKYTVFYGCGTIFHTACEQWDKYVGKKIHFCCDTSPDAWGKVFNGIPCISPDELFKMGSDCTVFITANATPAIAQYLKGNNVLSINVLDRFNLRHNNFIYSDRLENNKDKIIANLEKNYNILADKKSKEIFKAILTRIFSFNNNQFVMSTFAESDLYFSSDIIKLTDHENFIDAGAYTGDTLEEFLTKTNSKFDRYTAFEPDKNTFSKLKSNVDKIPNNNKIRVVNMGLWNEVTTVDFNPGGLGSTFGNGSFNVRTTTINEACKKEKITFIKMDIEGAELNALEGGANMIREHEPKLAISIYHKFEDLWEIPLYLKNINPEYKIYIRHYSNVDDDTVCYAVK